VSLILPVYDIKSRADAMQELKASGISEMALEQKCTRQVTNVELEGATLLHQLDMWGKAINEELSKSHLLLGVSSRIRLGDLA
jgi:hypothetical protein